MEIDGYKAFDKNMNNFHGMHFEEGKEYNVLGPAVFGKAGHGFHFCKRLEDTLRYVDGMNDAIQIAHVVGSGDIAESSDEYYGYYDMYCVSSLKVIKILARDEIVEQFLELPSYRVERFVKGYKLTALEIAMFKLKYLNNSSILKAIAYYQEGHKDAFKLDDAHPYVKRYEVPKGGIYG